MLKNPQIRSSLLVIGAFLLLALLAPLLHEAGPLATQAAARLQGPSSGHLLGTDEFGRDIFSRSAYGLRVSFFIGSVVAIASGLLGIIIGLISGYYPRADAILSRILDGMMAFPEIILAITLSAIWGGGQGNLIVALTFAYFPKTARIVRASVITAKARESIESARAIGAGTARILRYYIFPACVSPLLVQTTFTFASAVLSEAALSFLGVGIKEPAPSLGSMVSTGRNFMTIAPWMILAPGSIIMILVLALNLCGDGLRDALDPKNN